MASAKCVAYYRVSTARQGRSGLGLEAQRRAVLGYLKGGRWKLIAEFVEVESGRNTDRTELRKALAASRLHRATLVVAKFDRLSRNAAFLLTLRDSSVECVAVDMPDANRLTVGIMAMIAEHEGEAISTRTREALASAKKRGIKLGGNPKSLNERARSKGTAASSKARSASAAARAMEIAPTIAQLRRGGATSLHALAAGLNDEGIPTARRREWTATQVQRLVRQIETREA